MLQYGNHNIIEMFFENLILEKSKHLNPIHRLRSI